MLSKFICVIFQSKTLLWLSVTFTARHKTQIWSPRHYEFWNLKKSLHSYFSLQPHHLWALRTHFNSAMPKYFKFFRPPLLSFKLLPYFHIHDEYVNICMTYVKKCLFWWSFQVNKSYSCISHLILNDYCLSKLFQW